MSKVWKDPQTWDDIETLDQIGWPNGEVEIIKDIEKRQDLPTCEFLKTIGSQFYYCGSRVPDLVIDKSAYPGNPVYLARTDSLIMQIFCRGSFEKCTYYKRS